MSAPGEADGLQTPSQMLVGDGHAPGATAAPDGAATMHAEGWRADGDVDVAWAAQWLRTINQAVLDDSEAELSAVITRLLELAVTLVPGCDAASVSLRTGDTLETIAFTNGMAREADELQDRLGEGPALDVAQAAGPPIADGSDRGRWAVFAPAAEDLGVHAFLSCGICVPVPDGESRFGSVNLYTVVPTTFSTQIQVLALGLAAVVGLLLTATEVCRAAHQRERDLHRALASRDVIGQAKGILIERQGLTGDQAFDVLRRASMRMNVKLRDLAERVIEGDVANL